VPLHERRDDVIKRLTKVEGHIRGIRRMIGENRECPDILLQLAAVRAAINMVSRIVLEDHVESCLTQAAKEGKAEKAVIELKDALMKII
jgi:DNA-binding FrmR family transcriptional regulator